MKSKLTDLPTWQALQRHHHQMKSMHLHDLFAADEQRFENFSFRHDELFIDLSKNHITQQTIELFGKLAQQCELENKIKRLVNGEVVNSSENRPALHMLLRNTDLADVVYHGENVNQAISDNLKRMQQFCDDVQQGNYLVATGKTIRNIVNIGIGGSDLGPKFIIDALKYNHKALLNTFFVANIDANEINEVLTKLDPETTLFIIASKSFSTPETLLNAATAKQWLINRLSTQEHVRKAIENGVAKHLIAITANTQKALEFGIDEKNIFPLWDYVGGRYSVWSAIGLPIALTYGFAIFTELLAGAKSMDEHFINAELKNNLPMLLAIISIWYNNFFQYRTHAIIPYAKALDSLPSYLQQLTMESLGKSTANNGEEIHYQTSPIIWGGQGSNGQHAYFQMLHQGTQVVPIDFISVVQANNNYQNHQQMLLSQCFSQSKALMDGHRQSQAASENVGKNIPGNKPSTTILLDKLSPYNLGSLLALYEHKTFVESVIYDINAFDQLGVELGKKLCKTISPSSQQPDDASKQQGNTVQSHDSSTQGLIDYINSDFVKPHERFLN